MSDDLYSDVYDDETYEDSQPQAGGPKALREAYEKEKESRKALEERLARLEREDRESKLASALKESGVNPKVAGLVPANIEPDKVSEWLSEYGELFGVEQEERSSGGVDEATKQQIAAVSGQPTGAPPANSGDAATHLQAIDNEADFWAHIRANS